MAQVYVGAASPAVPRPPKELKGFVKLSLRPGETRRASATLDARAFAFYDEGGKRWRVDAGDYDVLVGRSSAQTELRQRLRLPASGESAR